MEPDEQISFGVHKPVGHIVIAFPTGDQASQAASSLAGIGVPDSDVHRYTDQAMLRRSDEDLARASQLASVGQELNLIKSQRELALQGCHWLIVRAGDDEQAARIAELARRSGAVRAQFYGRFIIEELIDRPEGQAQQVAESPDRGLDSQAPTGREANAGPRGSPTPPAKP